MKLLRELIKRKKAPVEGKSEANEADPKSDLHKKFWFYGLSYNNTVALKELYKLHEADAVFIRVGKEAFYDDTKIIGLGYRFFLKNFLYYPVIFLQIFAKHGSRALLLWHEIFLAYNSVTFCEELLQRYKPSLLFFANDSTLYPRAMLHAAKNLKIKTLFIQHACATSVFPPLKHDYALLDGQHAVDTYRQIGETNTKIYKIGMGKFERYRPLRNMNPEIERIGLCVNDNDREEELSKLVGSIRTFFPEIKVTVRFHPNYGLSESILLKENPNLDISDSLKENAFTFLQKQDLIIAGNSSIHLEAVLMNVVSVIYLTRNFEMGDIYGFIKNGLVIKADTGKEVLDVIQRYKDDRPADWFIKGRYYVENTEEESKAGIALREILSAL